jgi:hypothetical protein
VPAALRARQPPGEVVLANRKHVLSQLTFPSENHHRAGHTGRLRAATLADMGCWRMGFGLRRFFCGPVGALLPNRQRGLKWQLSDPPLR